MTLDEKKEEISININFDGKIFQLNVHWIHCIEDPSYDHCIIKQKNQVIPKFL